jgi:hypothetical protein
MKGEVNTEIDDKLDRIVCLLGEWAQKERVNNINLDIFSNNLEIMSLRADQANEFIEKGLKGDGNGEGCLFSAENMAKVMIEELDRIYEKKHGR